MTPKQIRTALELNRSEFARALGVGERTVFRWENNEAEPSGLASQVFSAIENAIRAGANAKEIGNKLRLGLGSLIYYGLTAKLPSKRLGR